MTGTNVIKPGLEKVNLGFAGDIDRVAYDSSGDALWFAAVSVPDDKHLYRYDINSGVTTDYSVLGDDSSGPYSGGIAVGNNGSVWLAFGHTVSRLNSGTRSFRSLTLSDNSQDAQPSPVDDGGYGIRGIAIDKSGRAWVSRFNTRSLLSIDPLTMSTRVVDIPSGPVFPNGAVGLPQNLFSLDNGSVLITFGEVELTSGAGLMSSSGHFAMLPGAWSDWSQRLAISGDKVFMAQPVLRGDVGLTLKSYALPEASSATGDNIMPPARRTSTLDAFGLKLMHEAGVASGGGVVWTTAQDQTSKKAYIVSVADSGTPMSKYEIPLLRTATGPSGSGPFPGLPAMPINSMVVDKRGDAWLYVAGYQELFHVPSER